MVVALAANERGTGFICGHDDGSIIRFYISEDTGQASGRLIQHQTSPTALAWANNYIVAAGCDRKILFYDSQVYARLAWIKWCGKVISFDICLCWLCRDANRVYLTTHGTMMVKKNLQWPPAVRMVKLLLSAVSIKCEYSRGVHGRMRGMNWRRKKLANSIRWPQWVGVAMVHVSSLDRYAVR